MAVLASLNLSSGLIVLALDGLGGDNMLAFDLAVNEITAFASWNARKDDSVRFSGRPLRRDLKRTVRIYANRAGDFR